jgi:hypothetical protein
MRVDQWKLEIVARDGDCLFLRCRPFIAYEIIQNNLKPHANTKEDKKCKC